MFGKHGGSRWRGCSGAACVLKVDRYSVAVDGVLLLLLAGECFLFRFGLLLRQIGGMCGRIWAVAVHGVALRGGHRRRASDLRTGGLLSRL